MPVSEATQKMLKAMARRDLRTPGTSDEAKAAVWALADLLADLEDTMKHLEIRPDSQNMHAGLDVARMMTETALNRAKYRRDMLLAEES